ncbi:MAG: glycosyltransferase family 39 protein, partial [Bacteroidia bacterium]|nr:glycosyltransferase family 39 protein [Bacteroidia bacterium]MDW8133661.1 glycosyltransferase family 39 protein [Bacteroidia bacterium]
MWWQRHSTESGIILILFFFITWSIGIGEVPLYDWDEVNFAECSREMRVTGEYLYPQIGFLPFWEKPPLFFWIQSAFMGVFGENAWGARIPNVIITTLTLSILFLLGKTWHRAEFGVAWVFLHGISLLPSFYARSGLIDPLFNLFMLGATIAGSRGIFSPPWGLLMGVLSALATLTKGPVGVLLPALAVGSLGVIQRKGLALLKLGTIAVIPYMLIVGSWIALLYCNRAHHLISDFFAYQWRLLTTSDAGHGGPFYYHIVAVAVGMLPASIWALGATRLSFRELPPPAQAILLLSAWTLLIFSFVKTKILHYSSLSY